jgi:hypothetical protein
MSVETGGAWLIGIILIMTGILSTIFPKEDLDQENKNPTGA